MQQGDDAKEHDNFFNHVEKVRFVPPIRAESRRAGV